MSYSSKENNCPECPPDAERDGDDDDYAPQVTSEIRRSFSDSLNGKEANRISSTGFSTFVSDLKLNSSEKNLRSIRSESILRRARSDSSERSVSFDAFDTKKREDSSRLSTFPGGCPDCAILLKENYTLIKKLNGVMNKRDRLQNQIEDLNEKNEQLGAALSKVIGERNRLLESMPNPRLFCNYTVTKTYAEWVEALKTELFELRNRMSDTVELLEKTSASERELCTTVARLEDSLIFYRQITRQLAAMKSPAGGWELPDYFDALYENKFPKGFSGMPEDGHPTAKSDVYAVLLEENDTLRKRLLTKDSDSARIRRENQELRSKLVDCQKEIEKLTEERDEFEEKCANILDEFKSIIRVTITDSS